MSGPSLHMGLPLGPYHLVRCLASGRACEVYLAHARSRDGIPHPVALKVLLDELGADPALFQHLAGNMEPALSCRHEAVARALELRTIDNIMVVASEYVEGLDLGQLLADPALRGQRLSLGPALLVARRVLEGVGLFHSLRDRGGQVMPVVHGNLHPGNVLLSVSGQVKISDFVLSMAMESLSGRAAGGELQLRYRSPEQANGDAVDHRTDIFTIGLLLYEGLAGRPAYDPDDLEDPEELEEVIAEADIVPLEELVEGLPMDLAAVVGRALEREPALRFCSAREMLDALGPCLRLPELSVAPGALAELVTRAAQRRLQQQRAAAAPAPAAAPPAEQAANAPRLELPAPIQTPPAPAPVPLPPAPQPTTVPLPPPPTLAAPEHTAVLPPRQSTGPQPLPAPLAGDAEPATSDRQTVVMEVDAQQQPGPGTDILSHTMLMQVLAQKDQQRTMAGTQQLRECTLFWCDDPQNAFVVEPQSNTQLFAWTPQQGRQQVELTPQQAAMPTRPRAPSTRTHITGRPPVLKLALMLVLAAALGLGAGVGLQRFGPGGRRQTTELGAGQTAQTGPWALQLAPAAVQRTAAGGLKVTLALRHPQTPIPDAGSLLGFTRGEALVRPDFWSTRAGAAGAATVTLVFRRALADPLLLRFFPADSGPLVLRLRAPGTLNQ